MINFKQFLLEIFDKPYPHEQEGNFDDREEHTFETLNKNKYKVFISHKGFNSDEHPELEFASKIEGKNNLHPNGAEKYASHRIFSTVKDITNNYLKRHNQESHIQFTADNDDPTKVKLYHALSKSVDPTYEHEKSEPDAWNMSHTLFKIKNPHYKGE